MKAATKAHRQVTYLFHLGDIEVDGNAVIMAMPVIAGLEVATERWGKMGRQKIEGTGPLDIAEDFAGRLTLLVNCEVFASNSLLSP